MRHWESDLETAGPSAPPNGGSPDEVLTSVALRLQRQLERQAQLVERLDDVRDRSVVLAQLRAGSRQLGRTGANLLILGGGSARPGPAMGVPAILREAVAAVADARRVGVGPAPLAVITAPAAGDLVHLVAELLEQAVVDPSSSPAARVEVQGRWTGEGGVTVEITGEGSITGVGGGALAVAARLGRRCGLGVTVRPASTGVGTTCVVHCAARLVTTEDAAGRGTPVAAPLGDGLFDPIDPGHVEDLASTPIFEAVASAWFRSQESKADPLSAEWEPPDDPEWAAATARAAAPETLETTSAGLPRRSPGTQMVTPPLRRAEPVSAGPPERAPERVRERLAVYQDGLRRGRHRAEDPPPNGRADDPWWHGLDA